MYPTARVVRSQNKYSLYVIGLCVCCAYNLSIPWQCVVKRVLVPGMCNNEACVMCHGSPSGQLAAWSRTVLLPERNLCHHNQILIYNFFQSFLRPFPTSKPLHGLNSDSYFSFCKLLYSLFTVEWIRTTNWAADESWFISWQGQQIVIALYLYCPFRCVFNYCRGIDSQTYKLFVKYTKKATCFGFIN
jgi:hypothetical protein